MQTFLTKVSQKKIKMIHLLLETERWCSIEELQNELKVSSKSILNYLTDLEELFQKYPDKVILKNENVVLFYGKAGELPNLHYLSSFLQKII